MPIEISVTKFPLALLVNFAITSGKEIQTINSTPQVDKTVTHSPSPWKKETTNTNLRGHREPQVFAGVQAVDTIFCNTENGADSLHVDIATAPTSYRRAIAVDRSFFTIGIGTIRHDI